MPSRLRKIDRSRGMGLHELGNAGTDRDAFRFQLKYAKEQIEDILWSLDDLVKNTIDKAPERKKDFCLDRVTNVPITHEEDKWERAMYNRWGPQGSGPYLPICHRIQAYQFPLQASRKDKSWGKVDLLGIGSNFLPVPNELKKQKTTESPP
jgi:hypothetical protein